MALVCMLVVPFASTQAKDSSTDDKPAAKRERSYLLECRIIAYEGEGSEKVLSRPRVIAVAEEPATFIIGSAVPIVSGAWKEGDAVRPKITVLETGTTMTFKITPDRPGYATVDAALAIADLEHVHVTIAKDGERRQFARVRTTSTRTVDCVKLGEKFELALDDAKGKKVRRVAQITVSEVNEPKRK
jgi:hypothetical protein